RYESREDRILILQALRISEKVIRHMQSLPGLVHAELAGSARRWQEEVSTIRIVACGSGSTEELVDHFLTLPSITHVDARTKSSAVVRLLDEGSVSFVAAAQKEYWNQLLNETGSRAHLKKLDEVAEQKGLKLSPTKLTRVGSKKALKAESEA